MSQTPTHPDPPLPGPTEGVKKGLWGRLLAFIDGHYIDREPCDRAFERMHRRDSIGDRIHLYLAMAALILFFGPVTMTQIVVAPLLVFFFVRVVNTFPVWIHGFGQPVVLAGLALAGWMMVSLAWSGDPMQGWDEIANLRWLVLVGLLFPVIEKRMHLIVAACIGIGVGQIGQVLDYFDGFGIEPIAGLVWNHPGRIAGWWHPVVGGSMLVAAMGLHLPAVLMGSGRTRVWGWLGFSAACLGLIATGTRGAWVAGVLMVLFAVGLGLWRGWIPLRRVVILGTAVLVIAAGGAAVMWDSLSVRIDESVVEIEEIAEGEYSSYSGMRVRMYQLAAEAFIENPIAGVGAGGYRAWCREQGEPLGPHAHNGLLHIASTLGIVGVLLWVLVLAVMVRGGWRIWDRQREGPYGLGPMLAIVGLMLASITDSIHINAQSAAMLGLLAALCPAYAPGHPKWPAAEGEGTDNAGTAE